MVAFTLVHEYLQAETSMKVGGLFRIQSNIRVCTLHVCSWGLIALEWTHDSCVAIKFKFVQKKVP